MPETTFWGLIVSFLLLAIGTTLKAAEASHSLKLANEEVTRLRKQVETLQNEPNNLTNKTSESDPVNKPNVIYLPSKEAETLHNCLALIAKYHSQEIQATPRQLAKDLGIDEGIMLAHLWKYHNEQYMTFCTGGKQPDLNTSYFLSPKAWELIQIVKA